MLLGKTLRISLVNWKVLVKSLAFQFLSLALFLSLASFAFGSLAEDVLNAFQSNGVSDTIAHTVQSLVNGTFNTDHFLNEDLKSLALNIKASLELVPNMWNRVEVSVAICVVAFLLYRFLVSCTDVAVGHQINEFMSSNTVRPFTWFLFKKAGESMAFVGLQMLFAIVFDTLIIAASIAMAIVCMIIFGWWAIIPVLVMATLLYTVRHSFMAFCLPSVVNNDGQKVGKSFGEGLSAVVKHFGKVFLHTLVVIVVMIALSAIAYLFNENRWISLSISTVVNFVLFFVLKCLNFVLYYEANNFPYFFKPILLEGTEQYNRKNKNKN